MKTREIMSHPAVTLPPEAPIREVARIMRENQFSGVPIVTPNGELLGLVTELDLIRRNAPVAEPNYFAVLSGLIPVNLAQYRHYRQQLRQVMATTVEQLMSTDVKVVEADTEVDQLMALMTHPEITLLPVVEADRVVGVVTRTDLVRMIEELEIAPEPPEAQ